MAEGETETERGATAIAVATFVLHLAFAGRYDFFRDELYFISCGRHPGLGYVDQPPLIPLIAAGTQLFGPHLVLMRLVPGLAHALTVLVSARLAGLVARRLSIDAPFAPVIAAIAAIAVAIAPMYLGVHGTLNTTSIEPLAWTLFAYLVAHGALEGDQRSIVLSGVVAGLSLEMKYAIPFFVAPIVLGLAVGPSRKILHSRSFLLAAALAVVIAAPSAIWQLAHGLPFLELMSAAKAKNVKASPIAFILNQVLVFNVVLAPIWVLGAYRALFDRHYVPVRFLGIGFIGVFLEMMLLGGKDYYASPAYPSVFAIGAVAIDHILRRPWMRWGFIALAIVNSAIAAPLAMPILDPPDLERYLTVLPIGPEPQEKLARNAPLPQSHADQLGWRELESTVADVWRTLSPEEQRRAGIYVSNYGEGGAIDFYGPKDGLPEAIGGHNQYFVWGPRGHDESVLVVVNGNLERWRSRCEEARVVSTFGAPFVMPYENERPIILCRRMKRPLDEVWSELKHYE